MRRASIVVVLSAALFLVFGLGDVAVADHCDERDRNCIHTGGDQDTGSIVTTGVNFPNAEPGSDVFTASQKNKNCKDCEWSIVPACLVNGPEDSGVMCMGAVSTCTDPAAIRYRVYMRQGNGPWVIQGTVCLGPDERPATVADVGQAIRTTGGQLPPRRQPVLPAESRRHRQPAHRLLGGGAADDPDRPVRRARLHGRRHREGALGVGVRRGRGPGVRGARWRLPRHVRGLHVRRSGRPTGHGDHLLACLVHGQRRGPVPSPGAELSKTAGPIAVPVREARSELIGG